MRRNGGSARMTAFPMQCGCARGREETGARAVPTGDPTEELRQPPEPGRGGGRARSPGVVIRHERPGDAAEIAAIIAEAFDGHPYSQGREASIVANLRRAKALVISLVAQTSA